MHYEAKVGHIGGNLSCLDALMVLHHQVLGPDDLFILSKGHAAGALYATLWSLGRLDDAQLKTFHQDGSLLAGHPAAGWHPSIRFATGSLGHGPSLAAGTALSRRLRGLPGRVYCLCSDGEWQEGSVWEALIFSAHQRLDALCILVDGNGLQGFGSTREVAGLDELPARLDAFGVDLERLPGHDVAALRDALRRRSERPRVLWLDTVKGHGVGYMENRLEWHYLPMNEEQYQQARRELGA
jgi:transketolase